MERGDIYQVSLDPRSDEGPQGSQFVIIVSPEAFNRMTAIPVVLPITDEESITRTAGFGVSLTGSGLSTTGIVRCDLPCVLDIKSRKGRKIESVSSALMNEVLAKLAVILEG